MSLGTNSMGRTRYQRRAHDMLIEHGFAYDHTNGKLANIYLHRDGRRVSVQGTPRNETEAINILKQNMRSPRLGLRTGESPPQTRGTTMAVTPTKTAPLVAMADPFLLKPAETKQQKGARQAALAGWVRRVLERHGPMPSTLLDDAAAEIGFSRWQIIKARGECGAIAWREGGRHTAWLVGLPHQKPEDRKSYSESVSTNGVAVVHEEPVPASAKQALDKILGERPPLVEAHVPDDAPTPTPKAAPVYGKVEIKDSDVAAAAQMLLDTLGIKGFDPRVGEALIAAQEAVEASERALVQVKVALAKAREALA